jgi:hypothetical protein
VHPGCPGMMVLDAEVRNSKKINIFREAYDPIILKVKEILRF